MAKQPRECPCGIGPPPGTQLCQQASHQAINIGAGERHDAHQQADQSGQGEAHRWGRVQESSPHPRCRLHGGDGETHPAMSFQPAASEYLPFRVYHSCRYNCRGRVGMSREGLL